MKVNTKKAVGAVGEQEDGTWVFGPDVYYSSKSELVDPEHTICGSNIYTRDLE